LDHAPAVLQTASGSAEAGRLHRPSVSGRHKKNSNGKDYQQEWMWGESS